MSQSESKNESHALRDQVGELITLLHTQEQDGAPGDALPDLRRLHDEIERLIQAGDSTDGSWIERLRHLIERIEIDHPQAVHVIGRISKSLSELGI